MKRFITLLIVIALVGMGIFSVSRNTKSVVPATKRLTVVTTLFPLFDMAKHIGGAYADISLLIPPGVEPHSFEPKPSDVARINSADIFIYTGENMEPWVGDILKGLTNKNLRVIDASNGVPMISAGDYPDPHIWLDFDNDTMIVHSISNALTEKDPEHAEDYRANSHSYTDGLSKLDIEYRSSLATCRNKDIIFGGHFAFGYLAKRYGLTYRAAQGLSPDAEPTANDLVQLVEQIRQNHVDTIYFEELTSPKIAETLAKETNTKLLLLNAGHNISKNDVENNKTFFAIMVENLVNLKTGLHCD